MGIQVLYWRLCIMCQNIKFLQFDLEYRYFMSVYKPVWNRHLVRLYLWPLHLDQMLRCFLVYFGFVVFFIYKHVSYQCIWNLKLIGWVIVWLWPISGQVMVANKITLSLLCRGCVGYTGTGTKFGAYLSPSPTLNDNIYMEKWSKVTFNTNYINYLSFYSSESANKY